MTRASASDRAVHKAGKDSMEEAAALVNAKRDSGKSQEIPIHALEQSHGLHHLSPLKQSKKENCGMDYLLKGFYKNG